MIRPIDASDIDIVVNIWLEASIIAHDFVDSTFWIEKSTELKDHYLPGSKTYVYEEQNKIVAFISMVDNYIAAIFVHPDVQGQGIGGLLIDEVKKQFSTLILGVYTKNTRSIAFYEKMGFKIKGEKIEEQTGELESIMEFTH